MGTIKREKDYKMPWSPLLLFLILFLSYIGFLLGLVAIPVVLNLSSAITTICLITLIVVGLSYFVFLSVWFNLFTFPVKKWILSNIRCPKCGNSFTKCEFNTHNISSFLSFAVYCENCKKAYIIETGILDKTLRFISHSKIALIYERKYVRDEISIGYKIPWSPLLLSLLISLVPLILLAFVFILISLALLTPSIVYFVTVLWLGFSSYWYFGPGESYLGYPIRRWVLNNIRCPKCGNSFTKCEPQSLLERQSRGLLGYVVYCEYCKKSMSLETGMYDRILKFAR